MSFKQKYLDGNNFIFSPRGKISRTRYFAYAFLLEVLYRILLSSGMTLGREVSPLLFILGFLAIPVIVLKMFNYKKRAYSFLNNNFLSYLYSVLYLFIGGAIVEYSHLLKLSANKALYELTQDSVFQQYANINIPAFIESDISQYIFYFLCVLNFAMFVILVQVPSRDSKFEFQKIKLNLKHLFLSLFTIIFTFIFCFCSYHKLKEYSYNAISHKLNRTEIEYLNNKLLDEYKAKMRKYESDIEYFNNLTPRAKKILNMQKPTRPMPPQYYGIDYYADLELKGMEFDKPVIQGYIQTKPYKSVFLEQFNGITDAIPSYVNLEFQTMGCAFYEYGIFKKTCGQLSLNKENTSYLKGDSSGKFNPKLYVGLAYMLSTLLAIFSSFILLKILSFLKKYFPKIKFAKLIDFAKSIICKLKNKIKFGIKLNQVSSSSLSDKLQELAKLKEQGLITEEDYNNKKTKLLEDF